MQGEEFGAARGVLPFAAFDRERNEQRDAAREVDLLGLPRARTATLVDRHDPDHPTVDRYRKIQERRDTRRVQALEMLGADAVMVAHVVDDDRSVGAHLACVVGPLVEIEALSKRILDGPTLRGGRSHERVVAHQEAMIALGLPEADAGSREFVACGLEQQLQTRVERLRRRRREIEQPLAQMHRAIVRRPRQRLLFDFFRHIARVDHDAGDTRHVEAVALPTRKDTHSAVEVRDRKAEALALPVAFVQSRAAQPLQARGRPVRIEQRGERLAEDRVRPVAERGLHRRARIRDAVLAVDHERQVRLIGGQRAVVLLELAQLAPQLALRGDVAHLPDRVGFERLVGTGIVEQMHHGFGHEGAAVATHEHVFDARRHRFLLREFRREAALEAFGAVDARKQRDQM